MNPWVGKTHKKMPKVWNPSLLHERQPRQISGTEKCYPPRTFTMARHSEQSDRKNSLWEQIVCRWPGWKECMRRTVQWRVGTMKRSTAISQWVKKKGTHIVMQEPSLVGQTSHKAVTFPEIEHFWANSLNACEGMCNERSLAQFRRITDSLRPVKKLVRKTGYSLRTMARLMQPECLRLPIGELDAK